MADITESSVFTPAIPEIAVADLVLGGTGNGPNRATEPLTNRTRWLLDKVTELEALITNNAAVVLQQVFPVGAIWLNEDDGANPSTTLGFGTWTRIRGRVLVGQDNTQPEFSGVKSEGGSNTHSLTEAEGPQHNHVVNDPEHSHDVRLVEGGTGNINAAAVVGLDLVDTATDPAPTGITLDSSGNGDPHNILQPYRVVYMWRRTA